MSAPLPYIVVGKVLRVNKIGGKMKIKLILNTGAYSCSFLV